MEIEMEHPTEEEIQSRIDSEPGNSEHYQDMGNFFLRNKEFDKAEKWLKTALEIKGDDFWTYLYMGNLYYQRKRHEHAISYFEQAIDVAPTEAIPYWCLAEVYEKIEDYEKANIFFERAVEIDPKDEKAASKLKEWREWYTD